MVEESYLHVKVVVLPVSLLCIIFLTLPLLKTWLSVLFCEDVLNHNLIDLSLLK